MKEGELLRVAVERLGLSLSSDQMECFASYRELLLSWNRNVNLISRRDEECIVSRHFVESLLIVPLLRISGREQILDVGTGAGFPGLPVKIMLPYLRVDLLEPRRRRASFLRKVIGVLNLSSVRVICDRIEEIEGMYDAIVTRAVARPLELLRCSIPLLPQGGDFIAYVPRNLTVLPEDLPEGVSEWKVRRVGLPGLCDERSILVARRG
jgi:16S rRNA (guanine527-N7)-methyltransferase